MVIKQLKRSIVAGSLNLSNYKSPGKQSMPSQSIFVQSGNKMVLSISG
jgi:hypothetical protein